MLFRSRAEREARRVRVRSAEYSAKRLKRDKARRREETRAKKRARRARVGERLAALVARNAAMAVKGRAA